jgi:hypothetical protein
MNTKTNIAVLIIVSLVVIAGASYLVTRSDAGGGPADGRYVALAQCIAESGTTFYGAFWCGHCKDQKEAFGDAVDYLPYVECSTPDGRGQLQECVDAGITSYPTWVFANGQKVSSNIAVKSLAEATGCPMPTEV